MRLLNRSTLRRPTKYLVRAARLLVMVLLVSAFATAGELTTVQREQIVRDFLAERPWAHRTFPRGKAGIRIEGDKITPSDTDLKQIVAQFGVAAKPGDRVRITNVRFVHHGIQFEINGGPQKRKKWTDRISVGVNGIDPHAQQQNDDIYNGATGSSIELVLKDNNASLTTDQIKQQLAPVLDFKALSQAEAYQKSLPPVLAAAIKRHHALVGMDKDMVLYTLGRPPERLRDSENGQDYEEWIYGTPPHDVEFVRFVGDKVVRIEDMKVSGEKIVRTADEVGPLNGTLHASARQQQPSAVAAPAADEQRSAPTLLRPGEKANTPEDASRDPHPSLPPDSTGPPSPNDPTTPTPPPSMSAPSPSSGGPN